MINRLWQRIRPRVDRLGIRLAIVLAVGLLPLMIVSIQRSQSVLSEALARSQAALVGETLQAVRDETILIEKSKAVALSLSHVIVPMLDDLDACNAALERIVDEASYSFAGFADTNGFVPCSSADQSFSYELGKKFREQIDDPKPEVLINLDAPSLMTSAVFASHPVFADDGTLLGFVRVTFPHNQLRNIALEEDSDALFLTLKADKTVLTSSGAFDDAAAILPKLEPGERISDLPLSFEREAQNGASRLYAIVPVVEDELYALATWETSTRLSTFYLDKPALFPALMWLASLVVAWFATSLFVTKAIDDLRLAMRDFAQTRRATSVSEFDDAPGELRELAQSFLGMSETIVHDEAELEHAVRQKDVLLREVHHRVKNNLQLVSSIMAMQMHQTDSPDVKRLMRNLQDRVNSIATVHHNLYQTSGQADVAMSELLESIVRQVVRVGAAKDGVRVETDIEPMQLNPDQAVPLSLFLTEALTNAMKYISKSKDAFVSVTLKETEPEFAELIVENTVQDDDEASEETQISSTGLGSELMEAFGAQLGGSIEIARTSDNYRVRVAFPIEGLAAKYDE